MPTNSSLDQASAAHAATMDRIYGLQRHFYDATRAYYLPGRDALLDDLKVPTGGSVLEIGCGTGRNLEGAARRYPTAKLFGLDISREMLRSAEGSLRRAGCRGRVTLGLGDASNFDSEGLFAQARLDRIFFSYALSMIPDWRAALKQGMRILAPGGSLHIIDFGGCERLPRWFRGSLHSWLERFHVKPRLELERELQDLAARNGDKLSVSRPFRGYSIAATLKF